MSAKTTIRKYCLWCCMDSYKEVTLCPSTDCAIWPFREGETIQGQSKQKAIKRKCEDCLNVSVRTSICKEKKCQLYPYREGHRPKSEDHVKKILTPEQIKAFAEHRAKNQNLDQNTVATSDPFLEKKKRRLITRIK